MLSTENRFNEYLLIGLRTSYGVNLDRLNAIEETTADFNAQCDAFHLKGWMTTSDRMITLTQEGRLRADYIASELFILEA